VQAYAGTAAPINFNGLVRQYYLRADPRSGDLQVNLVDKHERKAQSHAIATRLRPRCSDRRATAPTSRWSRCRPARRCCRRSWPRSTAPTPPAAAPAAAAGAPGVRAAPTAWSTSTTAASPPLRRASCCWSTGARPRWACAAGASCGHAARRPGRRGRGLPARRSKLPGRCRCACACRPRSRRAGRAAALTRAQRRRQAGAAVANW
jgi:hypothetical protein